MATSLLQSNSPAVDADTAYFEWNSSILINLNPEDYNNTAPDLGAFESSFSGSENNLSPVAIATANPQNGDVLLTVQFSSDGSNDPDGNHYLRLRLWRWQQFQRSQPISFLFQCRDLPGHPGRYR